MPPDGESAPSRVQIWRGYKCRSQYLSDRRKRIRNEALQITECVLGRIIQHVTLGKERVPQLWEGKGELLRAVVNNPIHPSRRERRPRIQSAGTRVPLTWSYYDLMTR
mgnify:CR=1 FL=1